MQEYFCKNCGKKCYSAVTEISSMTDSKCLYCGGEIAVAEKKNNDYEMRRKLYLGQIDLVRFP